MEIENKLKEMGLELPAAGSPPPAAPERSRLETFSSSAATRPDRCT